MDHKNKYLKRTLFSFFVFAMFFVNVNAFDVSKDLSLSSIGITANAESEIGDDIRDCWKIVYRDGSTQELACSIVVSGHTWYCKYVNDVDDVDNLFRCNYNYQN